MKEVAGGLLHPSPGSPHVCCDGHPGPEDTCHSLTRETHLVAVRDTGMDRWVPEPRGSSGGRDKNPRYVLLGSSPTGAWQSRAGEQLKSCS